MNNININIVNQNNSESFDLKKETSIIERFRKSNDSKNFYYSLGNVLEKYYSPKSKKNSRNREISHFLFIYLTGGNLISSEWWKYINCLLNISTINKSTLFQILKTGRSISILKKSGISDSVLEKMSNTELNSEAEKLLPKKKKKKKEEVKSDTFSLTECESLDAITSQFNTILKELGCLTQLKEIDKGLKNLKDPRYIEYGRRFRGLIIETIKDHLKYIEDDL